DDGKSFSTVVPLDVADFSRPSHAQLNVSGDTARAVWDDGTRAIPRILFRQSNDGGKSFGSTVVLSDTVRHSAYPVLTATSRGVAVAWTESGDGAPALSPSAPSASTPSHTAPSHTSPSHTAPSHT